MSGEQVDFFVSHAGADRAWAEWVAWQLAEAGYTVELDVWDWAAGRNFVTAMSDALDRCNRVVALFSAAYFERSRYTTEEWTAMVLHVPGAGEGRLVPVRIEEVATGQMPAVLRPLVSLDLFGVAEEQARRVLLEAVTGPRRPDQPPVFPGGSRPGSLGRRGGADPRLPGTMPRIWNIPVRNPGFTGRDGLLVAVREQLLARDNAVVQALHGMGGVGKTQLAAEYAHRFAGCYDLAWWVNSEQGALIANEIAALGVALGCVQAETGTEVVRAVVLAELRAQGRWLLVFDNAENRVDVTPWLPGGGGHVLITTRERGWDEIAAPVEVDVLARSESVVILQNRVPGLDAVDADLLAAELGDLPLAIAQAAGFMAETGMPAAEYLGVLRRRAGQLLGQGTPGSYPRSLAAATQLIADRLASEDPAAAELASLCAFLAPEPIPEDLFTQAASALPSELATQADDPLAWRQTLAHMARQSLARIDNRGLQMHRLTQAILRDRLTPEQAAATRKRTEAILAASSPGDPPNPATWPRWARLMPHLMAAKLAATDSPGLRQLTCDACWYLLARGDSPTVYGLASDLRQQWRARFGDDHEDVLEITRYLAWTLTVMGQYAESRALDQDTLARKRRILGEDHPSTLISANHLVTDLRLLGGPELQGARELAQDNLDRKRRVFGEDHVETLRSAFHLATTLHDLDELEAARNLGQDTLDRQRRILGQDHPDTLRSATQLALDLYSLGELQDARDLDQDTMDRRLRVVGQDHPDTLRSAIQLALDLNALGEVESARNLAQDTLDRQRRILGQDHPDTLRTATNLALHLPALGAAEAGH